MSKKLNLPERGLIIRQPWIELILSGQKPWEMRSKPTNVRGRIALIEQGTGQIVGECSLVHSSNIPLSEAEAKKFQYLHRVHNLSLLKKWRFAWELNFVERYKKPIPYQHPPGAVTWVKLWSNQ